LRRSVLYWSKKHLEGARPFKPSRSSGAARPKGWLGMPNGRSYWYREYLCATFVADSDEVPWFGEAWPFSSDAMCNEGRMVFGLRFGRAFVPHEIVGGNLSD
jgi:hypothetical protein